MEKETGEKMLLRFTEAAHRLNLGRSTLYAMVERGDLPTVHIGRSVRIPASALQTWIDEHKERRTDKKRKGYKQAETAIGGN